MGQRLINYCDLTGEEGDDVEFHTFSLDGKPARGLDLSEESWKKLQEALAPFLKASRPVTQAAAETSSAPVVNGRKIAVPGQQHATEERLALKLWADEKGVMVRPGQTPVAIWQAFYDDDLSLVPPEKLIKNKAAA